MTTPRQEILKAVEQKLRGLELAGVRRIPRLLPAAEAASATSAGADVAASLAAHEPPAGKAPLWGAMADQFRRQLGAKVSKTRPVSGAGQQPAPAVAAKGAAVSKSAAQKGEAEPSSRTSEPVAGDLQATLDAEARRVSKCTRCKQLAANRTQTVYADGPCNAALMFIGEGPGEDEDRQGVPFVGRAGQLLNKIITGGMSMRRDECYICNIVKCRPPGNRNPAPDEAANCREYLERQIELIRPRVICCLGGVASRFLLDDPTPVGKMRGQWRLYRGIPVRVTYHPAYLLRNYTVDARTKVWDDVKEVVKRLRELEGSPRAASLPPK